MYLPESKVSPICLAETSENMEIRRQIIELTFWSIKVGCLVFLVFFKLVVQRGKQMTHVWFYAKAFNSFILLAVEACLILFHYPFSMLLNFCFFLLMFTTPILPTGATEGTFDYIKSTFKSLVWIVISTTTVILSLFGTIIV